MTDIYLGRIVKAFGIQGELKFHPSEDCWDAALASKRLVLHRQEDGEAVAEAVRFKRCRPHGRNYVVKIAGVDDRNTAETYVGCEIFIAEDAIDVELPAALLPWQVVGVRAQTEDGEELGEVSSVIHSAAHDVYEVTGAKGSFLVPAVPEFIVKVDAEAGVITIRPMPGLFDG